MSGLRFHVEPRDVPPAAAARRLGLTEAEFGALLPRLLARRFPQPDPDTGHYDLDAIDEWRRRRHCNINTTALTNDEGFGDARGVISRRLEEARAELGERENSLLRRR